MCALMPFAALVALGVTASATEVERLLPRLLSLTSPQVAAVRPAVGASRVLRPVAVAQSPGEEDGTPGSMWAAGWRRAAQRQRAERKRVWELYQQGAGEVGMELEVSDFRQPGQYEAFALDDAQRWLARARKARKADDTQYDLDQWAAGWRRAAYQERALAGMLRELVREQGSSAGSGDRRHQKARGPVAADGEAVDSPAVAQ